MRLASSVSHQYGAEGLIRKQKNRCMYLCRPVWHPHWCYVHVAGRQGHTQTHTRHRSSRRTLPAMPSVASWRFTSQSRRPVSALLPLPSTPPMSWASGEACGRTLRQLPPTHLATRSTLRKFHQLHPLVLKEDPGTLFLLVLAGWLLKSVINHHRTTLKLIHAPKLN